VTHSLPSSLPAGFWSKAYIITSEVADAVTMAMLVKRSVKAIPNNSPWFLVIVNEVFTLFVKKHFTWKKSKDIYRPYDE
jgi:hypothetical protein